MFDQPSLSDLSNSLAPPNVQSTQCCVFPKSGVDQQEGAGCWKRSMIILGIWCIFELLLAALCCVLCRAELGGWLPYVGLKGLAPAVSTKELPAQIYLSTSCSWSAQVPSSHPLTKHPCTIQRPRLFVIRWKLQTWPSIVDQSMDFRENICCHFGSHSITNTEGAKKRRCQHKDWHVIQGLKGKMIKGLKS